MKYYVRGIHDYHKMKDEMGEYGFEPDIVCVDLNGAFVPKEKNAKDNLEMTVELNKKRFGL